MTICKKYQTDQMHRAMRQYDYLKAREAVQHVIPILNALGYRIELHRIDKKRL